nr:unnamed protein product [Spirometra erinaceieuropaei]
MSDSDATEPATDDFESRFLEIDDYSDEESVETDFDRSGKQVTENAKLNSTVAGTHPSKSLAKPDQSPATERSLRPTRLRRRPPSRYEDECEDEDEEDQDEEVNIVRQNHQATSSGLVRTRLGYQNSQSSLWSLEDVTRTPSETTNQPTAAQLEARLRRIVRRRESAKHKAEMEKMQTVEKLLRVNTNYTVVPGKGRGRGRRRKTTDAPVPACTAASSDSEDSVQFPDSNSTGANGGGVGGGQPKNALHPSATLDPPVGYIRLISSERFSPHTTVLALPPAVELSLSFPHHVAPPEPVRTLCAQCCIRPRRYACPKTGKPLCSLECFKTLRAQSLEIEAVS